MAFLALTAIEDVRDDAKTEVPFIVIGKIILNSKYITKVVEGIFYGENDKKFLQTRTKTPIGVRSSFICIKDDSSSPIHVIESVDEIHKQLTLHKEEEKNVT